MTHIEAMKQWLEAMEYADACLKKQLNTKTKHEYAQDLLMDSGTSMRQAIAEAEAEKVEYAYTCVGCDYLSWANNFSCECQSPPLMKFKRVKVIR